jgi:Ca2+-transporting ATPase
MVAEMNIETLAPDEMEPHRLTADDVLSALGTDPQAGPMQAQARERLQRYGRNELAAETPVPAWRKFVGQFTNCSSSC